LLFLRHNWLPLSLFSVVSAFVSHFLWSVQTTDFASADNAFRLNLIFLSSYYIIFLFSDLIYHRRILREGPAGFSPVQRWSGRALGPASLFLFSTLAVKLFYDHAAFWEQIHLFFFPFGILQLALTGFHVKKRNPDYPIYAAAGILFITLGLFSAFDAMTLNLALATEAMLLIVLARVLRFWVLSPLAQGVLCVHFVHYWLSPASAPATWPAFFGGVSVALVYLIKSRLEETQPPPEEAAVESISARWLHRLREVYHETIHFVAVVHALAGGVIVAHLSAQFFPLDEAAFAVAVAGCLVIVAVNRLQSQTLAWTGWLLHAAVVVFILKQQAAMRLTETSWLMSHCAALLVAAGAVIHWVMSLRKQTVLLPLFSAINWLLAAAAFLVIPAFQPEVRSIYPMAFAGALILWGLAERFGTTLTELPTIDGKDLYQVLSSWIHRHADGLRYVFAIMAALLTYMAVRNLFPAQEGGWAVYPILTAIATLYTLFRNSRNLLAAVLIHIALSALYLIDVAQSSIHDADPALWWTLFGFLASALAFAVRGRMTDMADFRSTALGILVCMVASLLVAAFGPYITEGSMFYAWIGLLAGVWLTIEVLRADGSPGWGCMILSAVTMVIFSAVTHELLYRPSASPLPAVKVIMIGSVVVLGLSMLMRSPSLAAAFGVGLAVLHLNLRMEFGIGEVVSQHTWFPVLLTIFSFVLGLMAEKGYRLHHEMSGSEALRAWLYTLCAVAYGLALWTVLTLFAHHPVFDFAHQSLLLPCYLLVTTILTVVAFSKGAAHSTLRPLRPGLVAIRSPSHW
ncbi:MAG: hypothetical protein AAF492_08900, partial [Verrucomicrobiota bacterium]